jgi:hypothetical protein
MLYLTIPPVAQLNLVTQSLKKKANYRPRNDIQRISSGETLAMSPVMTPVLICIMTDNYMHLVIFHEDDILPFFPMISY